MREQECVSSLGYSISILRYCSSILGSVAQRYNAHICNDQQLERESQPKHPSCWSASYHPKGFLLIALDSTEVCSLCLEDPLLAVVL